MAKKTKKEKYTCCHAHDYSTIELNGKSFLEIYISGDDEAEWQKQVDKVEHVVTLLNKAQNIMKTSY